ncbi:MAG: TRAP transporter large permease subunit [Gammaproteobacteria bacterium]
MNQTVSTWPERVYVMVIQWLNGAGVIWIFALMFLICTDISGRTLFNHPIQGVPEMVSLSLVGCLFLQLAYAVHSGRLTRTEVITHYLQKHRPLLAIDWQIFISVMAGVILLLIALGSWPDFWKAIHTDEFAGVEGVFTVSVWPIKLFVVTGALFAAIAFLRQAIEMFVHDYPGPGGGDFKYLIHHRGTEVTERIKVKKPNIGTRSLAVESFIRLIRVFFALLPLLGLLVLFSFSSPATADRTIGFLMIVAVLVLIMIGMPIAVALLLTGFIGIGLLKNDFGIATRTLGLAAQGTVSAYVFATVPLFVLMGMFVSVSDIGRDSFRAAQRLFGRIRGGLGVATVAANAIFAAITGISIASAAIFTKIAVPEMVRHGYTARFAVGLTAGSSVLGMLIPPSLLLIIYGVIAEVSIGGLFTAAVIPGLLLAGAFALGVILMAWYWPEFVGQVETGPAQTGDGSLTGVIGAVLPVFILILLVLGGIYGGVFTPTEAGAAGSFAAMLLAIIKRRLTWPGLWEVIRETGQVSVTILFLITAASTFSRMLTLTGLPQEIAIYLGGSGLGMPGFLAAYLMLLIALGTVLDSTSILLILLPLVLPVVRELGGDLIWFGVITVIGVEIGLLTPPLGLSVYVIKSTLDDDRISLGAIFAGAFPFLLITLCITILLMIFPQLSLVFV